MLGSTQRPQRGVTPAGQGCTLSVPVIGNFGCTYGACFRKGIQRRKGVADEPKEELIWGRRGAKRKHGTRSTARLLIVPFNHPASLTRVRSALPSASLVPADSSAGEASNTPHTALTKGGALCVPCPHTQRPQRGVTPAGQECTQSVPVVGNFGCTYGAYFRKGIQGKGCG